MAHETIGINILDNSESNEQRAMLRFFIESGEEVTNAPIVVPCTSSVNQLQILCNQLLKTYNESKGVPIEDNEPVPISFRTNDGIEIIQFLNTSLDLKRLCGEKVFKTKKNFYF